MTRPLNFSATQIVCHACGRYHDLIDDETNLKADAIRCACGAFHKLPRYLASADKNPAALMSEAADKLGDYIDNLSAELVGVPGHDEDIEHLIDQVADLQAAILEAIE